MKRIYLFGLISRVIFAISMTLLCYAMIDIYIHSNNNIFNLSLVLFSIVFTIVGLIWIHSLGVFMDIKNNRLKIVFGLGNENKYERVLTNIKALDIEKVKNVGINLIIIHNNGYSEKIYFKFYRVSFIEQILFNSFKRIIRKKWLYVNKVDTISENLLP